MEINEIPRWILSLELEDAAFLRNFVLRSGSLKEIAKLYSVSYPTVRLRLDKLIQKTDGTQIFINCTAVENEVADNRFKRSELDYLVYNDPTAYADLILYAFPLLAKVPPPCYSSLIYSR